MQPPLCPGFRSMLLRAGAVSDAAWLRGPRITEAAGAGDNAGAGLEGRIVQSHLYRPNPMNHRAPWAFGRAQPAGAGADAASRREQRPADRTNPHSFRLPTICSPNTNL